MKDIKLTDILLNEIKRRSKKYSEGIKVNRYSNAKKQKHRFDTQQSLPW